MKRLFFALWPAEQTRQRCVDIQLLLPTEIQPIVRNNLHVTLVFLGQIDQSTEQALVKGAVNIATREVSIVFDQLEYWKKPQVYCLTGRSLDNELPALVQDITALAMRHSINVDERPFKAHITLARKAKKTVLAGFKPFIWHSRSFCLVQSCSLPTGVEYRVLHSWGEL